MCVTCLAKIVIESRCAELLTFDEQARAFWSDSFQSARQNMSLLYDQSPEGAGGLVRRSVDCLIFWRGTDFVGDCV